MDIKCQNTDIEFKYFDNRCTILKNVNGGQINES